MISKSSRCGGLVFQDKNRECSTCVDFGLSVALAMGEAYDGNGSARRALLKASMSQFEHPSLSLQGDT
jgi:hypothetical protein